MQMKSRSFSAYFGLPQCTASGPAGYSCLINRHKANIIRGAFAIIRSGSSIIRGAFVIILGAFNIISIIILSMYIISRLLKFGMWLCFLPLVYNGNDMLLKRFIYKKVTALCEFYIIIYC
jgi:hypothetical protein